MKWYLSAVVVIIFVGVLLSGVSYGVRAIGIPKVSIPNNALMIDESTAPWIADDPYICANKETYSDCSSCCYDSLEISDPEVCLNTCVGIGGVYDECVSKDYQEECNSCCQQKYVNDDSIDDSIKLIECSDSCLALPSLNSCEPKLNEEVNNRAGCDADISGTGVNCNSQVACENHCKDNYPNCEVRPSYIPDANFRGRSDSGGSCECFGTGSNEPCNLYCENEGYQGGGCMNIPNVKDVKWGTLAQIYNNYEIVGGFGDHCTSPYSSFGRGAYRRSFYTRSGFGSSSLSIGGININLQVCGCYPKKKVSTLEANAGCFMACKEAGGSFGVCIPGYPDPYASNFVSKSAYSGFGFYGGAPSYSSSSLGGGFGSSLYYSQRNNFNPSGGGLEPLIIPGVCGPSDPYDFSGLGSDQCWCRFTPETPEPTYVSPPLSYEKLSETRLESAKDLIDSVECVGYAEKYEVDAEGFITSAPSSSTVVPLADDEGSGDVLDALFDSAVETYYAVIPANDTGGLGRIECTVLFKEDFFFREIFIRPQGNSLGEVAVFVETDPQVFPLQGVVTSDGVKREASTKPGLFNFFYRKAFRRDQARKGLDQPGKVYGETNNLMFEINNEGTKRVPKGSEVKIVINAVTDRVGIAEIELKPFRATVSADYLQEYNNEIATIIKHPLSLSGQVTYDKLGCSGNRYVCRMLSWGESCNKHAFSTACGSPKDPSFTFLVDNKACSGGGYIGDFVKGVVKNLFSFEGIMGAAMGYFGIPAKYMNIAQAVTGVGSNNIGFLLGSKLGGNSVPGTSGFNDGCPNGYQIGQDGQCYSTVPGSRSRPIQPSRTSTGDLVKKGILNVGAQGAMSLSTASVQRLAQGMIEDRVYAMIGQESQAACIFAKDYQSICAPPADAGGEYPCEYPYIAVPVDENNQEFVQNSCDYFCEGDSGEVVDKEVNVELRGCFSIENGVATNKELDVSVDKSTQTTEGGRYNLSFEVPKKPGLYYVRSRMDVAAILESIEENDAITGDVLFDNDMKESCKQRCLHEDGVNVEKKKYPQDFANGDVVSYSAVNCKVVEVLPHPPVKINIAPIKCQEPGRAEFYVVNITYEDDDRIYREGYLTEFDINVDVIKEGDVDPANWDAFFSDDRLSIKIGNSESTILAVVPPLDERLTTKSPAKLRITVTNSTYDVAEEEIVELKVIRHEPPVVIINPNMVEVDDVQEINYDISIKNVDPAVCPDVTHFNFAFETEYGASASLYKNLDVVTSQSVLPSKTVDASDGLRIKVNPSEVAGEKNLNVIVSSLTPSVAPNPINTEYVQKLGNVVYFLENGAVYRIVFVEDLNDDGLLDPENQMIVPAANNVKMFVLDSTRIYWIDGERRIKSMSNDGIGQIETLVLGLNDPKDMVVDGDKIYFAQGDGTIRQIDKNIDGCYAGPGKPTGIEACDDILVNNRDGLEAIALDDVNIYWADGSGIYKMAKTGGSKILLDDSIGKIYSLTSDGIDKPDLLVTDIFTSPENPAINIDHYVVVTVRNLGKAVSKKADVTVDADGIVKTFNVPKLNPGQSKQFSVLKSGVAAGYKVKATVVANFDEYDKNNNELVKNIDVRSRPDVLVSLGNPSYSADAGSSERYLVEIPVSLSGGSADIGFYIDGSREPLKTMSGSGTFNMVLDSGTHMIRAVADYRDNIKEKDENNNEDVVITNKIVKNNADALTSISCNAIGSDIDDVEVYPRGLSIDSALKDNDGYVMFTSDAMPVTSRGGVDFSGNEVKCVITLSSAKNIQKIIINPKSFESIVGANVIDSTVQSPSIKQIMVGGKSVAGGDFGSNVVRVLNKNAKIIEIVFEPGVYNWKQCPSRYTYDARAGTCMGPFGFNTGIPTPKTKAFLGISSIDIRVKPEVVAEASVCFDTDGDDRNTKGKVYEVRNGVIVKERVDSCLSGTLIEWRCDGAASYSIKSESTSGDICRDGQFVTPSGPVVSPKLLSSVKSTIVAPASYVYATTANRIYKVAKDLSAHKLIQNLGNRDEIVQIPYLKIKKEGSDWVYYRGPRNAMNALKSSGGVVKTGDKSEVPSRFRRDMIDGDVVRVDLVALLTGARYFPRLMFADGEILYWIENNKVNLIDKNVFSVAKNVQYKITGLTGCEGEHVTPELSFAETGSDNNLAGSVVNYNGNVRNLDAFQCPVTNFYTAYSAPLKWVVNMPARLNVAAGGVDVQELRVSVKSPTDAEQGVYNLEVGVFSDVPKTTSIRADNTFYTDVMYYSNGGKIYKDNARGADDVIVDVNAVVEDFIINGDMVYWIQNTGQSFRELRSQSISGGGSSVLASSPELNVPRHLASYSGYLYWVDAGVVKKLKLSNNKISSENIQGANAFVVTGDGTIWWADELKITNGNIAYDTAGVKEMAIRDGVIYYASENSIHKIDGGVKTIAIGIDGINGLSVSDENIYWAGGVVTYVDKNVYGVTTDLTYSVGERRFVGVVPELIINPSQITEDVTDVNSVRYELKIKNNDLNPADLYVQLGVPDGWNGQLNTESPVYIEAGEELITTIDVIPLDAFGGEYDISVSASSETPDVVLNEFGIADVQVSGDNIYYLQNGDVKILGGLDVAYGAEVFTVDDEYVYWYDGAIKKKRNDGVGQTIVVSSDAAIALASSGDKLYYSTGSEIKSLDDNGEVVEKEVYADELIYDGDLYYSNGKKIAKLSDRITVADGVTGIAISGGNVYFVDSDGRLWKKPARSASDRSLKMLATGFTGANGIAVDGSKLLISSDDGISSLPLSFISVGATAKLILEGEEAVDPADCGSRPVVSVEGEDISISARSSNTVRYGFTVKNKDPAGCADRDIYLSVDVPDGWEYNIEGLDYYYGTLNLAAGGSQRLKLAVTSPEDAYKNIFSIYVLASDQNTEYSKYPFSNDIKWDGDTFFYLSDEQIYNDLNEIVVGYRSPESVVKSFDVDSTYIYWIENFGEPITSSIFMVRKDGTGAITEVAKHLLTPERIAVGGGYIYWSDEEGLKYVEIDGFCDENSLSGCAVYSTGNDVNAVDFNGVIYWSDSKNVYAGQDIFTTLPEAPVDMVVDGAIYYVDGENLRVYDSGADRRKRILSIDMAESTAVTVDDDKIYVASYNGVEQLNKTVKTTSIRFKYAVIGDEDCTNALDDSDPDTLIDYADPQDCCRADVLVDGLPVRGVKAPLGDDACHSECGGSVAPECDGVKPSNVDYCTEDCQLNRERTGCGDNILSKQIGEVCESGVSKGYWSCDREVCDGTRTVKLDACSDSCKSCEYDYSAPVCEIGKCGATCSDDNDCSAGEACLGCECVAKPEVSESVTCDGECDKAKDELFNDASKSGVEFGAVLEDASLTSITVCRKGASQDECLSADCGINSACYCSGTVINGVGCSLACGDMSSDYYILARDALGALPIINDIFKPETHMTNIYGFICPTLRTDSVNAMISEFEVIGTNTAGIKTQFELIRTDLDIRGVSVSDDVYAAVEKCIDYSDSIINVVDEFGAEVSGVLPVDSVNDYPAVKQIYDDKRAVLYGPAGLVDLMQVECIGVV